MESFFHETGFAVLTSLIPLMSYSHANGSSRSRKTKRGELLRKLTDIGFSKSESGVLLEDDPSEVARQLKWLHLRSFDEDEKEFLSKAIEEKLQEPVVEDEGPADEVITVADLYKAITDGDHLGDLANHYLSGSPDTPIENMLQTKAVELKRFVDMRHDDRLEKLSNLLNRLQVFMEPPFLELCTKGDFRVEDAAEGKKIAFLLSSAFEGISERIGQVAIAQYRMACLRDRNKGRKKFFIADEFADFVQSDFGGFLRKARELGGAAVLATQSIYAFPDKTRKSMLTNCRSVIAMPGAGVEDANWLSQYFGSEIKVRESISSKKSDSPFGGLIDSSKSVSHQEVREPRFSATEISEMGESQALVRVTAGRKQYPVALIDVER